MGLWFGSYSSSTCSVVFFQFSSSFCLGIVLHIPWISDCFSVEVLEVPTFQISRDMTEQEAKAQHKPGRPVDVCIRGKSREAVIVLKAV